MEKEDPTNPEFVVPAKLKELYETKDFGRYALPNGDMPACFLTTNDITAVIQVLLSSTVTANSSVPLLTATGNH